MKRFWIGLAMIALVGAGAFAAYSRNAPRLARGPHVVIVNPKSSYQLSATAKPGESTELVHCFTIRNDGDAPLEVGTIIGYCGCSKHWIEEDVISPQHETKLWARINHAGYSRLVRISAATNDPERKVIDMEVDVQVPFKPPTVLHHLLSPMQLGHDVGPGDSRQFTVVTLEQPQAPQSWLRSIRLRGIPGTVRVSHF